MKPGTSEVRKVYYGSYPHNWPSFHPVIRLGGKYLERLGFDIGTAIKVEFEAGKITITKVCEPVAKQE